MLLLLFTCSCSFNVDVYSRDMRMSPTGVNPLNIKHSSEPNKYMTPHPEFYSMQTWSNIQPTFYIVCTDYAVLWTTREKKIDDKILYSSSCYCIKQWMGSRFMIHSWEEKVSTKEKAKIFQIKFRWKEAPCSGGLLKSCLLCQCSHLLPDWRLCLASAGAGSPVECCRLPPAGAQRSWLSSPSPPPPSRSPLTGSPEDTTAPSSHLWKRDAMGNISITASDFSARSSTVRCSVRWKAPHKNATWFETLKRRQQGTKLMNPSEYASLHISNYRPHVCPAAFRQMQKFNRGIFHAD